MKTTIKMAALLIAATPAIGADYPEKPVNLVVPFSAGGGTDLLARALAPSLGEALGGNVFVTNMPGGSGTVAAMDLVQKDPDGYNIGFLSVTVASVQPHLKDVNYDPESWTPICQVQNTPMLFLVPSDSAYSSMDEVKAAVDANPGGFIYGSGGPGAITHLAMVAAFQGLGQADKVKHLPFQGTGPAMQAMAGGVIQFFGDTELIVNSNDVRPLMAFSNERLESFPDVPTAAEVGIPAPLDELYLWGGLFAPAGLDAEVTARLSEACETAVTSAAFEDFAARTGTNVFYRNATDFADFAARQFTVNGDIVEQAGLK